MRASKYIFSLALVLIMSCSDFTNIQPTHTLTPNNAFQSMSDFDLLLNGVYNGLQNVTSGATVFYPLAFGTLPDIMSDNLAENVESLGGLRSTSDWIYVANDATISSFWSSAYYALNNCNILINNIDGYKETTAGQKNRIKGQAYALRAMFHFDLLRYFGQSYDRNSTLLGIPIKTVSSLDKPARNTVKEVYDQIYADLAQAKTLLSGTLDQTVNTSADRSRLDVIGVNAIQARVAYYAKDYTTAISSASAVITSGMGLASKTDFPTIWSADAIANEVIWYIKYFPGDGYAGGDVYFAVNDRVSYNPSQNLLSLYNYNATTNPDVRYTSYFSNTTSNRPGQLIVSKYIGAGDGLVSWKAFRVGEMYLIRAESYARTNQNAQGFTDLKTLQSTRGAALTTNATGPALLVDIATERRKELFLEGDRWFALRMAGQGITRGSDCKAPATVCSLPAVSPKYIWPIPQDEIKANPNIATQQNPGY